MKIILNLFLSAIFVGAASIDAKAEQEVFAAMDAYKQALIHKDAATLDKLLSEDLAYVHSGGQLERKTDVISSDYTRTNCRRRSQPFRFERSRLR